MSPFEYNLPKSPEVIYLSIILLVTPTIFVSSAPVENNNLLNVKRSTSDFASKVIYESPPMQMDKVLTDFLVTSKPLNLRKYGVNQKMKRPKKDSKIYFIPMPAMPYRFIPGVGMDYQPMKFNPIMMGLPSKPNKQQELPLTIAAASYDRPQFVHSYAPQAKPGPANQYLPPYTKVTTSSPPIENTTTRKSIAKKVENDIPESKIIRVKSPFHAYFFNGRPFKLKVAHADPKTTNLTPENLQSNFYINKNIIY